MMVQIGKSQSLHEDLITPSKRLATGSPSVNRVIDLVNNQYESNMQRLQLMFKRLDRGTIAAALTSCDNNLEKTIDVLGNKYTARKTEETADVTIDQIVGSTSKQEAVDSVKNALEQYNADSKDLISSLSSDNQVLKTAIQKVLNRLETVQDKTSENDRLRNELDNERVENCKLKMALCLVLGDSDEQRYQDLIFDKMRSYTHNNFTSQKQIPRLKPNSLSPVKSQLQIRTTRRDFSPSKSTVNLLEREKSPTTEDAKLTQRSAKRVNVNLKEVDQNLADEILARDRHINELNNTIIGLRQKTLTKGSKALREKEAENDELQKYNDSLVTENQGYIERISFLTIENEAKVTSLQQEIDENSLVQEALSEENETLKQENELKSKQVNEMRGDLQHFAKIVQDMTLLNNELNQKVMNMNADMEGLNSEIFQLKQKAENIDQLEENLHTLSDENQNSHVQVKKLTQLLNAYDSYKKNAEKWYENATQSFETLETKLDEIELGNDMRTIRRAFKVVIQTQIVTENLDPVIVESQDNGRQLKEFAQKVKSLQGQQQIQEETIEKLQSLQEQSRKAYEDAEARRTQQIKRISEENTRLREQNEILSNDNTQKDISASTAETKVVQYMNRINSGKKKVDDLQLQLIQQDEIVKKLSLTLGNLKGEKTRRIKDLRNRERRILQAAQQLRSYEEEIFNKDSDLLNKHKDMLVLEQDHDALKKRYGNLVTNMRSTMQEELDQANEQLQDKDQELQILKEMVRGSQVQAMTANRVANNIKRKVVNAGVKPNFSTQQSSPVTKRKSVSHPVYEILNDFFSKLRNIKASEQQKDSSFELKAMEATAQWPDPEKSNTDILDEVVHQKSMKISKLVEKTLLELSSHNKKFTAIELRQKIASPKLEEILDGRTEVTVKEIASNLHSLV